MTAPTLPTRARVLDDPATQAAFFDALRSGLAFASAANIVGLTREAVRLYRKGHPEFNAKCMEIVAEVERRHVENVNTASADDAKFSQWFLERRFPQRWSQRQEMRVMDADENDDRDDHEQLSDEELEKAAR